MEMKLNYTTLVGMKKNKLVGRSSCIWINNWCRNEKHATSFKCVLLLSYIITVVDGAPSRHVSGDKLHHYSQQLAMGSPVSVSSTPSESDNVAGLEEYSLGVPTVKSVNTGYLVYADHVNYQSAYEPSINPFLSHIEHGWKMKPLGKHRSSKKRRKYPGDSGRGHGRDRNTTWREDEESVDVVNPLPMDPSKPHFMDSDEAADVAAEENKAFGDGEKDLRELFNVLFSPDYNS